MISTEKLTAMFSIKGPIVSLREVIATTRLSVTVKATLREWFETFKPLKHHLRGVLIVLWATINVVLKPFSQLFIIIIFFFNPRPRLPTSSVTLLSISKTEVASRRNASGLTLAVLSSGESKDEQAVEALPSRASASSFARTMLDNITSVAS